MRSRMVLYRARPALACIIGASRAWTVEMISPEEMPLQVGVGRGEVRVPQLALDRRQRDAPMQALDGVGMAKLVGAKRRRTPGLERIWSFSVGANSSSN